MTDGLEALQSAVVIMGLPFAVVLFLMMFGLFKGLTLEGLRLDSHQRSLSGHLSGRTGRVSQDGWKKRLARSMHFPNLDEVQHFLADTARPAMEQVRDQLRERSSSQPSTAAT
jgi:choline/glycine/proline betaine transport protein